MPANNKMYKPGDYVYFAGWGIGKVETQPVIGTSPDFIPQQTKPDPLRDLLRKDEPKSAPFILGMTQKPDHPKHLRVTIIPEDRINDDNTHIVENGIRHLVDPFDQETLDRAIEECGKVQEPRFDDLKDVRDHVQKLINSPNLVDVGRAYAYAYGHEDNLALKGFVVQAVKILISQKGYLDFIAKGRSYDGNELRRTGRRLNLPKPQGPITPLIGQEPAVQDTPTSDTAANLIQESEEPKPNTSAPKEEPAPQPQTIEQRQDETLLNYFNEIATQTKTDDVQKYQELCFLYGIFSHEKADQLNFRQKYIILQELFGPRENRDSVIQHIRVLGESKSSRNLTKAKYKSATQAAFSAITNVIESEGGLSLEVHEDAADHPEAFDRLVDRIEAFTP